MSFLNEYIESKTKANSLMKEHGKNILKLAAEEMFAGDPDIVALELTCSHSGWNDGDPEYYSVGDTYVYRFSDFKEQELDEDEEYGLVYEFLENYSLDEVGSCSFYRSHNPKKHEKNIFFLVDKDEEYFESTFGNARIRFTRLESGEIEMNVSDYDNY